MEPSRSSDSVRTRLQLAQLLRRLRAIRKDEQCAEKTQAERVELALAEAEDLSRFIKMGPTGPDGHHAGLTRLDRRKLSDEGLAQRRGERAQESRSASDCR
jgi:hypothetical protein